MGSVVVQACVILVILGFHTVCCGSNTSFVVVSGTQFFLDNHPLYVNGFNAYWMTQYSYDPNTRTHVTDLLRDAAGLGLNVARTWAFNDGSYRAIQISPGNYSEEALQGLDFVVSEARSYGVMLILSLCNNYKEYGGKPQYVQWAREAGCAVYSEDDFFRDPVIKGYYKDYVKTVITRVNTFTGVPYKDDPTILAWELMNEIRCNSDTTGDTVQAWIEEMSEYVKSLDNNHLLEAGLEGFYGAADVERNMLGSWSNIGTDFIRNNRVASIDFATVHSYPELWLPRETSFESQLNYLVQWVQNHLEDATMMVGKPVLFAEFGKSSRADGYTIGQRDRFFSTMYGSIFSPTAAGRWFDSGAGGLLWQLVPESLCGSLDDGFLVVPSLHPSTVGVISTQSQRVSTMNSGR